MRQPAADGPRRWPAGALATEALVRRDRSVSLVLPVRDEAGGIRRTVAAAVELRAAGVLDEVVVVDGGSGDGTPEAAAAAGATVVRAGDVRPEVGPVLGKGDAMWRALTCVDADVVAFLDGDLEGDIGGFVRGLVGPLLLDDGVDFVKGAFHRVAPDGAAPDDPFDGGRVTELMARPLLNLWRPDLAAFYQPLGGQVAARGPLLRSLPLLTGYAVEVAMLVDVVDRVGLDRVAEVELGRLRNRPRPTSALAPMAQEVLFGFLSRVLPAGERPGWRPYVRPRTAGRDAPDPGGVVERPPVTAPPSAGGAEPG